MTTKYKYLIFSGLLAWVLVVAVSCNLSDQEDYDGLATISASSPTVTVDANDFENIPGVEEDATYTYTVSLSEPQIADVKIQVFQSGGTATEDVDFALGEHTLVIPAYETSTTGSLTIFGDTEPEDSETLDITIGDISTANATWTPTTYSFVLDNFVSDVLDIEFAFCVDVFFGGDAYVWSDFGGDPDIFVSDAEGFDITDPWATWNSTDYAATGDCPEVLTMDKADWGDGEYVLWHELYSNVNYAFWDPQPIPIVATFVQAGLFRKTVIQDDSQAVQSNDIGAADGDYAGTNIWGGIARVTIAGDTYTIADFDGNELLKGIMVDGKMTAARPSELNKAPYAGVSFEE